MTKTIKKAVVIKALKKESLVSGAYFATLGNKGCDVCAVGAVLRAVSFEKWAIKKGVESLGEIAVGYADPCNDDYKELLKERNWLGALSNFFEQSNDRAKTIAFVKEHFPAQFKLTIKEIPHE